MLDLTLHLHVGGGWVLALDSTRLTSQTETKTFTTIMMMMMLIMLLATKPDDDGGKLCTPYC